MCVFCGIHVFDLFVRILWLDYNMAPGLMLELLCCIPLTTGTQVTLRVSLQFYEQCSNLLSGISANILLRMNDLRPWHGKEILNDAFRGVHVPVQ